MVDSSTPDATLAQRRLLLEQIESRLRVQFDELDGLDRKATTVLAASSECHSLTLNSSPASR
jgi:hypothetical protein